MTYSVKPVKDFLQVFDALTGAPYFNVPLSSRGLQNYFLNGNTLTVTFQSGVTEIWDLSKRSRIR